MKRKPSWTLICLLAGVLVGGCGKPVVEPEVVRPVRAIKVGDLKALQGREFPGRAAARDEVELSFRVSGPLVQLPVDVGSTVKKGDVIAAIDPTDFQAALDSAQASLGVAQANLLAMERGARPEEIEQLKAAVAEAQASYQQAFAEHQRQATLLPQGAITQSEFDVSLARRDGTAARLVDNAIVVTDGIMVRIAQGMDRKQAAIEAASGPAWPLLGATVVASMAFYPIFASTYDTGEYAGSLFTVVAISLLLSWVFCQTAAPLLCMAMLPSPKPGQAAAAPYQSAFFRRFRGLLSLAIRYRVLFLGGMIGLLVLSVLGFRFVPQLYFPDSSRRQVMIDYWAPEGTRIQQTSVDLERIEKYLQDHSATAAVSVFVGKGPPRFYLPVSGEDPLILTVS